MSNVVDLSKLNSPDRFCCVIPVDATMRASLDVDGNVVFEGNPSVLALKFDYTSSAITEWLLENDGKEFDESGVEL